MKSESQRLAVISDVHGNADALRAAESVLAQHTYDKLIVLGDLLTYGGQPHEVLQGIDRLAGQFDTVFIRGNHDQFYFDLDKGKQPFYPKTPEFVRESVRWTHNKLAGMRLADRYDWKDSFGAGPVFIAHANPYEYGDWSYVADADGWQRAANTLRDRGYLAGVFGHSHRSFMKMLSPTNEVTNMPADEWIAPANGEILLMNSGAVGQSRGTGLSFLDISIHGATIKAHLHQLSVDMGPSKGIIAQSGMSSTTQEKLISYLEKT
ncbi:metallophosphoesterase family protein [Actibacterium lipolyticum]|uniref:Diadenosine tetraphosphatase n=1 Tax=Actibacterium lipolyticum TaxID=1524263 RepID=A0A238KYY7_9RHOB|nr:metallophosphoesterase family protein [Actibacterium lipolyticum]SMX47276.1 diadenosine tetraphosphatase [Actibacterium lipolyticum]